MEEEINYLKEESSADPEIKEKVDKILEENVKNLEDANYIAEHCNAFVIFDVHIYLIKFEYLQIIFNNFSESTKEQIKTNLKKFHCYHWNDSCKFDNFTNKKDSVENLSKNIDYIMCSLGFSNDEKFNIVCYIIQYLDDDDCSIDSGDFRIYILDFFLNLCKNKYKFSQDYLETLSESFFEEEEKIICGYENSRDPAHVYDIGESCLKYLESIMKICKKYEIPQKKIKFSNSYPLFNYFLKHRSNEIYNS